MDFAITKFSAILMIFSIGIAAGIFPFIIASKAPSKLRLTNGLASGFFISAAFFHLLPRSIPLFVQYFDNMWQYIPIMSLVLGFAVTLVVGKLGARGMSLQLNNGSLTASQSYRSSSSAPVYLVFLLVLLHCFAVGATWGIHNRQFIEPNALLSILVYKGCIAFALMTAFQGVQVRGFTTLTLLLLFAITTPLGIGFSDDFHHWLQSLNHRLILAQIHAFSAGAFLYIGTLHRMHISDTGNPPKHQWQTMSGLAIGVVLLSILSQWFVQY